MIEVVRRLQVGIVNGSRCWITGTQIRDSLVLLMMRERKRVGRGKEKDDGIPTQESAKEEEIEIFVHLAQTLSRLHSWKGLGSPRNSIYESKEHL